MAVDRKPHLTQQAHTLIKEHFTRKNILPATAIDATCGNGLDTLFLANYVTNTIYAFDVQAIALENTREKLNKEDSLNKVKLIQDGHENMSNHVKTGAEIIMFNFGYLPQADKSLTTMTNTSVQAVQSALSLISQNGIISILCYPGHEEGKKETLAIRNLLLQKRPSLKVKEYLSNYPSQKSPVLFMVSPQ